MWDYKMSVRDIVLKLQLMISAIILGPVCDVNCFYIKSVRILT